MKGMDPGNFDDYLTIFKYGMPPHGGFGMGLERLTMTLLHLKNIREASLFPSDTKRIAGNRIKAKIVFGGENIRNEIVRRLRDQDIPFEHFVHEETATSQTAANIRNTPLEEGVKSLIVRGKNSKKNYQFNLPANLKLDLKAVAEIVGEKCDLENPEVIKERYGLIIGGVPPFGNLLNLENYFDEKVFKSPRIVFSCGLRTESVQMLSKDLMKTADPKISHFSKAD